eukprot:367138_1
MANKEDIPLINIDKEKESPKAVQYAAEEPNSNSKGICHAFSRYKKLLFCCMYTLLVLILLVTIYPKRDEILIADRTESTQFNYNEYTFDYFQDKWQMYAGGVFIGSIDYNSAEDMTIFNYDIKKQNNFIISQKKDGIRWIKTSNGDIGYYQESYYNCWLKYFGCDQYLEFKPTEKLNDLQLISKKYSHETSTEILFYHKIDEQTELAKATIDGQGTEIGIAKTVKLNVDLNMKIEKYSTELMQLMILSISRNLYTYQYWRKARNGVKVAAKVVEKIAEA